MMSELNNPFDQQFSFYKPTRPAVLAKILLSILISLCHSLSFPLQTKMPWLLFHGTDGVWVHYLSTETLRRKRLSICWSLAFFQTLSPFSCISRIPYKHFWGFQQYDITTWLCYLLLLVTIMNPKQDHKECI